MLFEVTKIQKYSKCIYTSEKIGTQYYYTINIRVFTDETKKRFYKLHFVLMFDAEDLAEYYDKEEITDYDVKQYRDEIAYFAAANICYNDNIIDIARECNDTMERYDTYNYLKRYNV